MIDKDKIKEVSDNIDENVNYFNEIIDSIVKENTQDLDIILMKIDTYIVKVDNPSAEVIEKAFLELTNYLYFMQEKVEKLNIYDSLSKISYKDTFNERYMNPKLLKEKPTVAELTSYAERCTIYEQSMNEVYNKAYRIVKSKVDSAQVMVQTLSKVLSKRMSDSQLSNRDNPFYLSNSNGRILNE